METRVLEAASVASVDVHWDLDPTVLDAWAQLEAVAPCSIYQTRAWLLPWIEAFGHKAGLKPFYVIARGIANQPLALLCLGLRRVGPIKVATFLGGKDSNFNLPLVQPGLNFGPETWRTLLRDAAALMGSDRPCAFLLLNQPAEWSGHANSLSRTSAQLSSNVAFGTKLAPNAEAFLAGKLSNATRKKLRRKEARLAARGPLTYRTPAAGNETAAILDALFAQKTTRFRAQNIVSGFDDPAMRRFIDAASVPGPHGVGIELHALYCADSVVAVYGGGTHRGCWSGMFNSFDAREDIARSSPGDLLLMAIMAKQCAAGIKTFDLGIGEARYKATFCGDTIPLFDGFFALTPLGWLFLSIEAMALRMKGRIKGHHGLFRLARRLNALWHHRKKDA